MPDERPIGVFDSGVGGLTVLRALHQRLPHESTLYVGDLARCPYGPRPQREVRSFVLQIADHFAREDIKLLVLACNTATAAGLDALAGRYAFPIVGVVAPGARAAAARTRSGVVGVIATIATVQSDAYARAVLAALPEARVVQRSASWLVPLIERGPLTHAEVTSRLQPTLQELHDEAVDTLILGCTHFPLVADVFSGIGPDVVIVDSAETTAIEVETTLQYLGIAASGPPRHRLLVTGPAEAFAERAQAMFRSSPLIEGLDLELAGSALQP